MPELLPIQEGEASGKPYSAALAQLFSPSRRQAFYTMTIQDTNSSKWNLTLREESVDSHEGALSVFCAKYLQACTCRLGLLLGQHWTWNRALGRCRRLKSSSWMQGPHLLQKIITVLKNISISNYSISDEGTSFWGFCCLRVTFSITSLALAFWVCVQGWKMVPRSLVSPDILFALCLLPLQDVFPYEMLLNWISYLSLIAQA